MPSLRWSRVASFLAVAALLEGCKKKLTYETCVTKCAAGDEKTYEECLRDNPKTICDEARTRGSESCHHACDLAFDKAPSSSGSSTNAALPAPAAAPLTDADVKDVLARFVAPGADHAALSKQLRPTTADYAALFDPKAAAQIEAAATAAWDEGKMVIAPKPGQSEFKTSSATTTDFLAGTAAAKEFPGGYARVAPHLNLGVTLHRFSFVEPGKDLGMAFDGLSFTNGHWVIVPKPWRMLGPDEAPLAAADSANPSPVASAKGKAAPSASPAKGGSARAGAAQVSGRLPPEVIQRIVRRQTGAVRLCYEKGLASDPNLHGTVKVRFVIDRSGAVSTAQDGGSDLPSPSVVSCVVRAMGNLQFPQPEGGIVTVVYPFTLSPG